VGQEGRSLTPHDAGVGELGSECLERLLDQLGLRVVEPGHQDGPSGVLCPGRAGEGAVLRGGRAQDVACLVAQRGILVLLVDRGVPAFGLLGRLAGLRGGAGGEQQGAQQEGDHREFFCGPGLDYHL